MWQVSERAREIQVSWWCPYLLSLIMFLEDKRFVLLISVSPQTGALVLAGGCRAESGTGCSSSGTNQSSLKSSASPSLGQEMAYSSLSPNSTQPGTSYFLFSFVSFLEAQFTYHELTYFQCTIWVLIKVCVHLLSHFSRVWLCANLWTAAHQALLSMGFSRQESRGSSLPGIKPMSLKSNLPWQAGSLPLSTTWEALIKICHYTNIITSHHYKHFH